MKTNALGMNIALMAIFAGLGLTQFTDGVRSVQIIGLFASGAAFGIALGNVISYYRSRGTKAQA